MHTATYLKESTNYREKIFEDLLRKAEINEDMLQCLFDIHYDGGILPRLRVALSVNTATQTMIMTIPKIKIEVGGNPPRSEPSVYEVDQVRFDKRGKGWYIPLSGTTKDPIRAHLAFKDAPEATRFH
jgi:hypothetical protein